LAILIILSLVAPQAAIAGIVPPVKSYKPLREKIIYYADAYSVSSSTMLRIANCEGKAQFNPDGSVLRGRINPKDVGIFQVNERWHLVDSKKLGMNIYTVEGNIEYSMWLASKQGLKPWSASKNCWTQNV